MNYLNLKVEQKEAILIITINRESKLNALNRETLSELRDAVSNAFEDPTVRGVVITGSGSKAFAAGADIAELKDLSVDEGTALSRDTHTKVFDLIERGNKPVIAAINGYALGGGLELAMACHLRIAATPAKMGLPELKLGLIPGYGGTQRLPQLVGKGKALEIILTAAMIDAREAEKIGLVNRVVEAPELLPTCEDLLNLCFENAPSATGAAIRAVNASSSPEGKDLEMEEFGKCFGGPDFIEGLEAFLAKRKPNYK